MYFSIAILAISLSLDALGAGVAYGIRKIKIPLKSKLTICFFSILYSFISLYAGGTFSKILSPLAAKLIGIGILLSMGVFILVQNFIKKDEGVQQKNSVSGKKTIFKLVINSLGITIQIVKNPVKGDIDESGTIDFREALLLGLALSVDAIGVGFGSALAGFKSMYIPFAVGAFQLLFLYAGCYLGNKSLSVHGVNKKALALAPGVLLIILALLRIK